MKIREMTAADAAHIIEMMRVFYTSPAVMSNGSEEIFRADVDACIRTDNPYLEGYVFCDRDEIAGYAMVAKSFSTEFGKPCVWIEDLYVTPAFRGCGVGTEFLNWLEQKYPACIHRLEAEEDNHSAVRLYRKSGFEELPYLQLVKNRQEF